MRVINVHERRLGAAPERVGALLDQLASEEDQLWPRKHWPPMRFDRPLAPGAAGGHGPIRYTVEEYRPGALLRFRFTGPRGFVGHHRFEVLAGGPGCILRHTLELEPKGAARLSWLLLFRPLHDALVEDAFGCAQAALGEAQLLRPWSPWVRILRWVLARGRKRPGRPRDPR